MEDGLKADLSFLYISSVVLEFVDPNLKKTSLANIVEDIRESMLGELDFVEEGKRLSEFREFLSRESVANVVAPAPFVELTTEKVLVMDYIDGVSMLDKELIESRTGPMTSEQVRSGKKQRAASEARRKGGCVRGTRMVLATRKRQRRAKRVPNEELFMQRGATER